MAAKEMFEKLGYHQQLSSPVNYYKRLDVKHFNEILFIGSSGKVVFSSTCPIKDTIALTLPEIRAIAKQCEELGWLEEDDNN